MERMERLGNIILIGGLLSMLYPPIYQTNPPIHEVFIGAQITAVALGIGVFYFYYRVIFTPRFLAGYKVNTINISKLTGVHIISPEEYETVKREIENLPVLAFLRSLNPADNWHSFVFTTAQIPNGIQPTDLYKVPEIARRYLPETSKKRDSGYSGNRGDRIFEDVQRIFSDSKDASDG